MIEKIETCDDNSNDDIGVLLGDVSSNGGNELQRRSDRNRGL